MTRLVLPEARNSPDEVSRICCPPVTAGNVYCELPRWLSGKESALSRRWGFEPWVRKIPWSRKWQPTPVLLPGELHGQRSLAGYSPWHLSNSTTTAFTAGIYCAGHPSRCLTERHFRGVRTETQAHRQPRVNQDQTTEQRPILGNPGSRSQNDDAQRPWTTSASVHRGTDHTCVHTHSHTPILSLSGSTFKSFSVIQQSHHLSLIHKQERRHSLPTGSLM